MIVRVTHNDATGAYVLVCRSNVVSYTLKDKALTLVSEKGGETAYSACIEVVAFGDSGKEMERYTWPKDADKK